MRGRPRFSWLDGSFRSLPPHIWSVALPPANAPPADSPDPAAVQPLVRRIAILRRVGRSCISKASPTSEATSTASSCGLKLPAMRHPLATERSPSRPPTAGALCGSWLRPVSSRL